jgi:hypothetical protein
VFFSIELRIELAALEKALVLTQAQVFAVCVFEPMEQRQFQI